MTARRCAGVCYTSVGLFILNIGLVVCLTQFQPRHATREAIGFVYQSYNRAKPNLPKLRDRDLRHPEWTRRVLDAFGSPDKQMLNIAVTGSKGKGSHSILLAGILERLGLRVGLFTGPHLIDFMERFRCNGQLLPEPAFVDYIRTVAQHVEQLDIPEDEYIGPVGLLAVVAALWFRDCGTDVNIFECGRGALHDDVNQVQHQGAVLSPVFLEHAWELGPTLQDVAAEKAGVVTPTTQFVVSNRQFEGTLNILRSACDSVGSSFRVLGSDFSEAVQLDEQTAKHLSLTLRGSERCQLLIPEVLHMYASNAAVALETAVQIWRLKRDEPFPNRIDLRDIRLPGRFDQVRTEPLTVVDGTIHAQSARYIESWVNSQKRAGRIGKVGAILGVPADKDGQGVLEALKSAVDWVVIARARNPHLHFEPDFAAVARKYFQDVHEADYIDDAVRFADSRLNPRAADMLLVLGTQSFVGDALAYFDRDTQSIWNLG